MRLSFDWSARVVIASGQKFPLLDAGTSVRHFGSIGTRHVSAENEAVIRSAIMGALARDPVHVVSVYDPGSGVITSTFESSPVLARYAREIEHAKARGLTVTAGRIEAERDEYLGAIAADCDQCGCPVPRATLAILTRDATGEPDLYCCRACRGAHEDAS